MIMTKSWPWQRKRRWATSAGTIKPIFEMTMEHETTDITLFVRLSNEDVARWDRQRIVDALLRETIIDVDTADAISKEVEKQILSSGISLLTSALVRELVD